MGNLYVQGLTSQMNGYSIAESMSQNLGDLKMDIGPRRGDGQQHTGIERTVQKYTGISAAANVPVVSDLLHPPAIT